MFHYARRPENKRPTFLDVLFWLVVVGAIVGTKERTARLRSRPPETFGDAVTLTFSKLWQSSENTLTNDACPAYGLYTLTLGGSDLRRDVHLAHFQL